VRIYFADTNVFLRFLIQDNLEQYDQAKNYFSQAKAGKIKIFIIPEIILEIDYVLKKVYSLPRIEVSSKLLHLTSTPYFEVKDRDLWIKSLEIYNKTNFDLVDIFLFTSANREGGEVLSFDQDFNKLKRLHSRIS
jgi:predicted nucleic-acid-binding protein